MTVRGAAGSPNSQREYDAYGREAWTGIQTDRGSYRFAGAKGYQNDDPSGMRLLGARYYLPNLGRFLTQDPIGHEGGQHPSKRGRGGASLQRLSSDMRSNTVKIRASIGP